MGLLRMELDGEKYEIDLDKLTLDEAEILESDYGMSDFTDFNFFSAKQMKGLFHIAVKREHPELDDDEIGAKIGSLEAAPILEDIQKQVEKAIKDQKQKATANPPNADAGGASASKTRAASGRRRSAASTT